MSLDYRGELPVLDFEDFVVIIALFHFLIDIRIKLGFALNLHFSPI